MNSSEITNIQDLKGEIMRLRQRDDEQEAALAARFGSPSAVISTAQTLFSGASASAGRRHPDHVRSIARFLIPLVVERTLFRHSNFLVRFIVGVGLRKASGLVTERLVRSILAKSWPRLGKLFHKDHAATEMQRRATGIPT